MKLNAMSEIEKLERKIHRAQKMALVVVALMAGLFICAALFLASL
jgi:formate/nitrite transporter FocA (FNT family)